MARYDTYSSGDDRIIEDLDSGYIGFNNRLRPDQLVKGILADSQNGRLAVNGEWQTRKGISNVLAPLVTGANAMTLPFYLLADDSSITVTQTSNKLVITGVSVANFTSLSIVELSGITGITPDPNGFRVAKKDSSTQLTIEDQSYSGTAAGTDSIKFNFLADTVVNEVYGSCKFSDPNSVGNDFIMLAGNEKTVAVSVEDPNISFDITYPTSPATSVSQSCELLQAFNKLYIFQDGIVSLVLNNFLPQVSIDPNFNVQSDGSENWTIQTTVPHGLSTSDKVQISGTSEFFDGGGDGPYTINGTQTVTSTPSSTQFVFQAADEGGADIGTQPNGIIVLPMAFEFVESGSFTQPQVISTAAQDNAFINDVFTVVNGADVSVGQRITCLDNSNNTSGLFETIGNDQVNFIAERTERARFTVKEVFESASAVGGGVSSSPGIVRSTSTLTITTNSAHGLKINQPIVIASSGVSQYNGNNVVASVPSSISFTVELASASGADDTSGNATVTPQAGFSFLVQEDQKQSIKTQANVRASGCSFQRTVSDGTGFTHMPAPSYATYHQRRLAVPYKHRVETAVRTYTETDRNFDEILISDILDHDTYDQLFATLRFNAGMSDFNVGMHSFSDDKLIVFNRNSIHLVIGSEDIATSKRQLLTDEVGLLARKSVVQVGNQILFLSDNGVYGANFLDLYNLRGNEIPLSEAIQSTIDRINKNLASLSSAVYFDNRYYIALPLDTTAGQGDAKANNALLIYNFLNKSWESIDNINDENFEFTNLLVTGKGNKRGVYVTNTDGGIHRLETESDGIDRVISSIGGSTTETRVQGSATTRMFTLNSIDRKKWNNFELQLQSSSNNVSDINISGITENVDSEPALDLKTASFYLGSDIPADEDVSIRGRIGNRRAYGFQMVLTNTLGRPSVRAVKVAGAETFRSTSSVQ